MWLLIGLFILLLLMGLGAQIININRPWPFIVLSNYIGIENYTILTRILSLLYEIDQNAHEFILNQFHDLEKFHLLIHSQSTLSLSMRVINRELAKLLVCVLKKDSRVDTNNNKARFVFLNRVILVRKQIRYSIFNAFSLHDLYTFIKSVYHIYNLTVAKTLDTTQLNDYRNFLINAQPLLLQRIGIDFKKWYWDL